jgi:hypothetical protein
MAITHAEFARTISRMIRDMAGIAAELAEGMHNPNFCSDDATQDVRWFVEDIGAHIEHLRKRAGIAADPPNPSPER